MANSSRFAREKFTDDVVIHGNGKLDENSFEFGILVFSFKSFVLKNVENPGNCYYAQFKKNI